METFVGDIVTFEVETTVDLTGLTLELHYFKPDGSEGIWNAVIDPTDTSVALYTTQQSDLDMVGTWRIQVYASSITKRSHGKLVDFKVRTPIIEDDDI